MRYIFTITVGDDARVVNPIYKQDISKNISKESGQEFFREGLSGNLKFVGADFEWLNSFPLETEFKLAINQVSAGTEPVDAVPISAEHITKSVPYGSAHGLPQSVGVQFSDGTNRLFGVMWESSGSYQYNATIPRDYAFKGVFDELIDDDNPNKVSASALVTVNEMGPRTVSRVTILPVRRVDFGTTEAELNLPIQVRVVLDDESSAFLEVHWATSTFEENVEDTFTFTGELVMRDNITNPAPAKTASISVLVEAESTAPLYVKGVALIQSIHVPIGTNFGDIPRPRSVQVQLSDNSFITVQVNWLLKEPYDPNVAKVYTLEGTLGALPSNVENPSGIKAELKIYLGYYEN